MTPSCLPQSEGSSSVLKDTGVTDLVPPDRTVSELRKDFETDGKKSSDHEPNATEVVRGKLMNTQLLPFLV
ncbi:hypothetical protein SEPCBS119000_005947 [Sporothrix epigloea]|uniref:Uncharacterized protein n=1 Tax=Sporothrix epigloea TaxID=1892477 RepID=A0ABP0E278_9PEZI